MLLELWNGLKTFVNWLRGHLVLSLTILSAGLAFVLRIRSGQVAGLKAENIVAAEKGKTEELKNETKQAEKQAADSRSDYERLAAEHRPKQ